MILVQLFSTFFIIGLVSFGGGYAMIPFIQELVVDRFKWMSVSEFTDVIAVAGMSPGPIATNSATIIGYNEAGIAGAVLATIGIVLPSFIIIMAIALLMHKLQRGKLVGSAFYGLRPAITGLIVYAAIILAINNDLVAAWSWHTFSLIIVFVASLAALLFFRIHPVLVILASGAVGAVLYS